jgi:uncharacterized membrane protein
MSLGCPHTALTWVVVMPIFTAFGLSTKSGFMVRQEVNVNNVIRIAISFFIIQKGKNS